MGRALAQARAFRHQVGRAYLRAWGSVSAGLQPVQPVFNVTRAPADFALLPGREGPTAGTAIERGAGFEAGDVEARQ
jgi:hypothetical protein